MSGGATTQQEKKILVAKKKNMNRSQTVKTKEKMMVCVLQTKPNISLYQNDAHSDNQEAK